MGLLDTLLYDVTGRDPVVFGVCAFALAAVTLAATWVPARAATRIAPTEVMRVE